MKDFVSLGNGESRYLKSNIPSNITHEELVELLRNGTFPFDFNGVNQAGIRQLGTALNKANLLSDDTANKYLQDGATATPDTVFNRLADAAFLDTQTVVATPAYKTIITDVSNVSVDMKEDTFLYIPDVKKFISVSSSTMWVSDDGIKWTSYYTGFSNNSDGGTFVLGDYVCLYSANEELKCKISSLNATPTFSRADLASPACSHVLVNDNLAYMHNGYNIVRVEYKDGKITSTPEASVTDGTSRLADAKLYNINGDIIFCDRNEFRKYDTVSKTFGATKLIQNFSCYYTNHNIVPIPSGGFYAILGLSSATTKIRIAKVSSSFDVLKTFELDFGADCGYTSMNSHMYLERYNEEICLVSNQKFIGAIKNIEQEENAETIFYKNDSLGIVYVTPIMHIGLKSYFMFKNAPSGTYFFTTLNEETTKIVGSITDVAGNIQAVLSTARIETGSYTGTGTYGANNPNTLTFDFEPKILILNTAGESQYSSGQFDSNFVWIQLSNLSNDYSLVYLNSAISSEQTTYIVFKMGHILEWYNRTSARYQFNTSNVIYYWTAIG